MNCVLTLQEKLQDLRKQNNLNLDDLAEATGLSRSALSSYENNEFKDISLTAIIKLARFYNVSTDYLLGLTEVVKEAESDISVLRLDDETIEILKSGAVNSRLLCEIIKHPDFWKFMSDAEIYIDNIAAMQIRNFNSYITLMRKEVQARYSISDADQNMRTLEMCAISEDDYFSRLLCDDITKIARDIKKSHRKDSQTGDENNPLTEVMDIYRSCKEASDPEKAKLYLLGKQLGLNFAKMEPQEVVFFTDLVQKYSTVYKSIASKTGRGKKQRSKTV